MMRVLYVQEGSSGDLYGIIRLSLRSLGQMMYMSSLL